MQALVKTAPGDGHLELLELPEPEPGPGEVKIRVFRAGICGTDIKLWRGHYPASGYRTPVVLGHEFSGHVSAVGPGVKEFRPDELVCAIPTYESCGSCRYCRSGEFNLCAVRKRLGFDVDGAFAGYVIARSDHVHRLPASIDPTAAALLEPLSVATRAVLAKSAIVPGDRVLVFGPGPIGLLVAMVASVQGGRVTVAGLPRDEGRLRLAAGFGAEAVTLATGSGVEEAVRQLVDAMGGLADVVLECSGTADAVAMGLEAARPGGRYVQVGTAAGTMTVPFMRTAYRELHVTGSFGAVWSDWERAIQLLAGGYLDVAPLISAELPLAAWHEGMTAAESGTATKVLLDPHAPGPAFRRDDA